MSRWLIKTAYAGRASAIAVENEQGTMCVACVRKTRQLREFAQRLADTADELDGKPV